MTSPTDAVADTPETRTLKPLSPQFSYPQLSDPHPCSEKAAISPVDEVQPEGAVKLTVTLSWLPQVF